MRKSSNHTIDEQNGVTAITYGYFYFIGSFSLHRVTEIENSSEQSKSKQLVCYETEGKGGLRISTKAEEGCLCFRSCEGPMNCLVAALPQRACGVESCLPL